MNLTESELSCKLDKVLESHGCFVERIVGSKMNRRGRPDRYVASLLWSGWLEAKLNWNKLSPYQKYWHEELFKRVPKGVYTIRYFQKERELIVCSTKYIITTLNLDDVLRGDKETIHKFLSTLERGCE